MPQTWEKCRHRPAAMTALPVPLPRSTKMRLPVPSPPPPPSALVPPYLSRSSVMKSCMSISPYTSASVSSSEVPSSSSSTMSLATSGRTCSRSTSRRSTAVACAHPLSLHALRSKRLATPFSTRLRSF